MNGEALMAVIQSTALAAVASTNPSDYCVATVMTVNPLSVQTEQQETLTADFLILTDLVRDFNVDISVNHTTENRAGGAGDAAFASHNHVYVGRKRITVHNGLSVGEKVILIRQAGGQEFIVLSRVHDHTNVSGQWG